MAAAIPTPLKTADIARFAHRAGQLEKAKPVVAYYCYYWILDQVIAKGLHNTDDECKTYTTTLMDKLEQMKVDHAENNAITDDMAGHAYIEQFGHETFQRADKTMNANKVTRQTADTFQAAATFLDLGQIWGSLDTEITSKIKYAKYHALRIAKALKAGEDPNLSNPVPEPNPEDEALLDPNDPEVQAINGTGTLQDTLRQPSVEEVPDEQHQVQPSSTQHSAPNESLPPSRAPEISPQQEQHQPLSPPDQGEGYYANTGGPDVSPLGPSSADRTNSSGGGYFPAVPDGVGRTPSLPPNPPPLDSAPPHLQNLQDASSYHPPSMMGGSAPLHSSPPLNVESVPNLKSSSTIPPPAPYPAPAPSNQVAREQPTIPIQPHLRGPGPNTMRNPMLPPTPEVVQPAAYPVTHIAAASQVYVADEDAILKAQKHARWAISALNFEDVKTAVMELKGALESLGAG